MNYNLVFTISGDANLSRSAQQKRVRHNSRQVDEVHFSWLVFFFFLNLNYLYYSMWSGDGIAVIIVNIIDTWAISSSVEFSAIWILCICIDGRRSFWLIKSVRSFVLFPHSINDEHDNENGAQESDHCSADDSCKDKKNEQK